MTRVRILAVDDEPGMLRAIGRVLGAAHDVTISGSSREALARAAAAPPDLAILDIRMPELDGFELMERLTALHPNIDVILMTGSIDDQDEKLVRAIRGAAFYFIQKPFDRDVLRTLVDRCVEMRRRREDNRRYVQRLERELDAARTFQQGLLPDAEAVAGGVRISCRHTPSSELGGDLYDYAPDRSGGTALLIADVAGHGAAAAMLTAVVKSAFRASEPDGYDPLAVTERVRRSVAAFGEERFVTLIAMQISRRTPGHEGMLSFVNAGHPPGLLWNAGGRLERLAATGLLISPALPYLGWNRVTVPFAPGDHVLLYTDGATDALFREMDGESRIRATIAQHVAGGPGLLDAILADIGCHRPHRAPEDDITLVTATLSA
jgi:phosphoserine phosphatase RsbU/P